MIRRPRLKLTYANVVATLALFVALGGSSYAAIALPRNSVGAAQIRPKAVRSSELASRSVSSRVIRDGSVGVADISTRGKAALRGRQGPAGPQGPVGAVGPSGVTFSAGITTNSTTERGSVSAVNRAGGTNEYVVTFPTDVTSCVSTATLATVKEGFPLVPPPGRITVAHPGGRDVIVRTFDETGAAVALPFNILVAC